MIKPSRRTLVAGVLVLGLGLVLLVGTRHRDEPVFEGKTLSFWLRQYRSTSISGNTGAADPALNEQAAKAVRAIGTNAIPALLRMIRARDSSLTLKLLGLAYKQHQVRIPYRSAYEQNIEGADGLLR